MKAIIDNYDEWYSLMDSHWSYEGEENIGRNELDVYLARTAGCKIDIFATRIVDMFCDEDTLVPVGQWFTTKEKYDKFFNVDGDTIISIKSDCTLLVGWRKALDLPLALKVVTAIKKGEAIIEEVVEDVGVDYYPVKYLDEMLYVKNPKLCVKKDGQYLVNTPKNMEHFGYITWKGQVYTPYLSGYHSSMRTWRAPSHESAKYRIGFEIEKESRVRSKISSDYLRARFNWVAESDSSLGTNGYELVSPVYNLLSRKTIKQDLEVLRPYIDGGQGSQASCGGHINISQKGLDGYKLLRKLKGFAPLLYAMYPDRVNNGYSRVHSFDKYIESPCKQAFFPKRDRLEIRIFPVVKDVEDMMLRYELIRYMMTQSTKNPTTVIRRLLDPTTVLHTIITDLGFEPKVLAEAMLEADAKYDNTKYTETIHIEMKKYGLTIKTQVKPTVEAKRKLKTEFKKFMNSKFMKSFKEDHEDLDFDTRDTNKWIQKMFNKRFEKEFL